ncbi:MAG: hypothetical protein IJC43_02370, partial [Clostridia bacterium]|nr:hypothetical protein [Clostridia bacterium]
SSMLFSCLIFLALFWTGILPADVTTKPGLVAATGNFGVGQLLVNMGTISDLDTLLQEWRTVLIACAGLVGIGIIAFTVGPVLFGREYSLIASAPISGGTIATVMMQSTANAAGRPELAGFAVLVSAFQMFFGMPVATWGMKKEVARKLALGDFDHDLAEDNKGFKLPNMTVFKPMPEKYNSSTMYLMKLALVAMLAQIVGQMTMIPGSNPVNYYLNPNIAYLLFGLVFAKIGFLENAALQKSGSYGLVMLGLLMMLPGSLAAIDIPTFIKMLWPLFGMLALCLIPITIFGAIAGKFCGYSPFISAAIACTCMFGYPGTELLTNEVTKSTEGVTEEQRERIKGYLLPKMVVGGFTTVTIASVFYAGIISPLIF